jgi:hypothetical protein
MRASAALDGRPTDQSASGPHQKEVDDMAAWRSIEEESGTDTPRPRRKHNGYYAGDFSNQPLRLLTYRNGQWETRLVWPAP